MNKDHKEIEELRKSLKEFEGVRVGKEKSEREARRLKDIINTQKHQVRTHTSGPTGYMYI